MIKVIHNIKEFMDTAGDVDKILTLLYSTIFSVLHFFFGPLIASPYLLSIISLIALDTLLGAYEAIVTVEFTLWNLVKKLCKKITEYIVYIYVALLITKAPLTVVVVPISSLVFTYIFLREGTSVLKIAARVFGNKHMGAIADTGEDSLDHLTGRNNDTTP